MEGEELDKQSVFQLQWNNETQTLRLLFKDPLFKVEGKFVALGVY